MRTVIWSTSAQLLTIGVAEDSIKFGMLLVSYGPDAAAQRPRPVVRVAHATTTAEAEIPLPTP